VFYSVLVAYHFYPHDALLSCVCLSVH